MDFVRSGGILLHPTSLPGRFGIGDLGPEAFRFIDWLSQSGCRLWQVLPLGPTGYGDSPYQCFSAFAGNPYLISPELLIEDGLLQAPDLADVPDQSPEKIDFGRVIPWKLSLLEKAFERFKQQDPVAIREAFSIFQAENINWLDDFAFFMALKESQGGGSWIEWPSGLRKRNATAMAQARLPLSDAILKHAFYQFIFFKQWNALKDYAHEKGMRIIGDIPIFVAIDSSDVWAHPDLFRLDAECRPTVVAGVPPDYFSPTGQLWGNPLYRWERHKETGYEWWLERFHAILKMVDIVRLDHFRGFSAYWEIPAGNPTAEIGRWVPGPGADLFDVIAADLLAQDSDGTLPIIAEDLGVITTDVVELRERYHLPGMKILQFGFGRPDDPFLPHMYKSNCVAYTGTHDNDTARGWFATAPDSERKFALSYLLSREPEFSWQLIRAIWSSVAMFAIAPIQDLLDLGGEARMNYPSRLGGNWSWRMKADSLSIALRDRLNELNRIYYR